MRIVRKVILNGGLGLLAAFALAPLCEAQIVGQIDATVSHSFIIGAKTYPAGTYQFRMQGGSDMQVMSITNAKGDSDEFGVRQSTAPTTPAHSQLVFKRYGDKEFLSKIYEGGNASGVAVSQNSKEEKELLAQGKQPVEHTE